MYRQPDPFARVRGQIVRAGAPVTIAVIVTNAVFFLLDYFGHGIIGILLWCRLFGTSITPLWSPLTYALDTPGFINIVFGCLWLWWMGGSLERSWGSQRFGIFAAAIAVLTAVCVWAGTSLLHTAYALMGLWIPLSALTVAWASINPRQSVLMYMVLPVPAWALAAFEVGFVYFVFFNGSPALGLFGLLPCAAAYAYVRGNFQFGLFSRRRGPDLRMSRGRRTALDGSGGGLSPARWWRNYKEQRRLRKLWRDSGFSDRDR